MTLSALAGRCLILLAAFGFATPALAQSVAEFYKGKSIDLIISSSVGGGYDLYARTIARFMPRYIPGNPSIVPKNMTGAGGLRAANWLFNVAPKDGTVFGSVQNTVPFQPLLGEKAAQFDPLEFGYVGSANSENALVFVWHASQAKTFQDTVEREFKMAATGGGSTSAFYANALNAILGTKYHVITGYPGSTEAFLAVERGEVDGYPAVFWSTLKTTKADWLKDNKIRLLVQMGLEKHPDLPGIPLIIEFAKTEDDRRALELLFAPLVLGRPFITPPGVPDERLKTLQDAFTATMKDPEFLKEAEKLALEVQLKTGDDIQRLVKKVYATPKAIVERVAKARLGS